MQTESRLHLPRSKSCQNPLCVGGLGAQRIGNNVSSKCTTQVLISTSPPCSLWVFQQGKESGAWISCQLQLQIGRSLESYSHIDEHQAGSQQHPGFYGKVGDQLHLSFPSAVLAPSFPPSLAALPCCAQLRSMRPVCGIYVLGKKEVSARQPVESPPLHCLNSEN